MQVDRERIEDKIDIIERDLEFLNSYNEMEDDTFSKSFKDIQAVKYTLFEIIEACIDISSHIISVKGYKRAESYAELFTTLGQKKVVPMDLSENLANMARFRNLLVHAYAKVDNSKVLHFIKEDLGDVRDFIKNIIGLL